MKDRMLNVIKSYKPEIAVVGFMIGIFLVGTLIVRSGASLKISIGGADGDDIAESEDAVKSAIDSIVDSISVFPYDSEIVAAAHDICEIAKRKHDSSSVITSYAISALSTLIAKCEYSSSKKQIVDLIKEIVTV